MARLGRSPYLQAGSSVSAARCQHDLGVVLHGLGERPVRSRHAALCEGGAPRSAGSGGRRVVRIQPSASRCTTPVPTTMRSSSTNRLGRSSRLSGVRWKPRRVTRTSPPCCSRPTDRGCRSTADRGPAAYRTVGDGGWPNVTPTRPGVESRGPRRRGACARSGPSAIPRCGGPDHARLGIRLDMPAGDGAEMPSAAAPEAIYLSIHIPSTGWPVARPVNGLLPSGRSGPRMPWTFCVLGDRPRGVREPDVPDLRRELPVQILVDRLALGRDRARIGRCRAACRCSGP